MENSQNTYTIEYLLSIQDGRQSLTSFPVLQLQSLSFQTEFSPEISNNVTN